MEQLGGEATSPTWMGTQVDVRGICIAHVHLRRDVRSGSPRKGDILLLYMASPTSMPTPNAIPMPVFGGPTSRPERNQNSANVILGEQRSSNHRSGVGNKSASASLTHPLITTYLWVVRDLRVTAPSDLPRSCDNTQIGNIDLDAGRWLATSSQRDVRVRQAYMVPLVRTPS
jgi:hypothetical protein